MRRSLTCLLSLASTLALATTTAACGDDTTSPPASEDVAASTGDPDSGTTATDPDGGGAPDAAAPDALSLDAGATTAGETADQKAILSVPLRDASKYPSEWTLPGLQGEVQVVYTEVGVPHLYAKSRHDLMLALGFVVARDRFFILDLQRRLGLGKIAALLGDAGLDQDMQARQQGVTYVADRLVKYMSDDTAALFDAFADGMNAYIDAVKAGDAAPPSELAIAAPLLGVESPIDLMEPWDRRSLAGAAAVILYNFNYETDDIGRTKAAAKLGTMFAGQPNEALRREGFQKDIWDNVAPLFPDAFSTPGYGLDGATPPASKPGVTPILQAAARHLEPQMLDRLIVNMQRWQDQQGRDRNKGYGSNAWAVGGVNTPDGSSLLAGDGHLQLDIPALFYQVAMDTQTFNPEDSAAIRQIGLLMTGMPLMAVGTNGHVAWSSVNPVADITDWYREELQLDANGAPQATFFQGEWKAMVKVDETFEVAGVLGATAHTETWARYTTFDGRWLSSIEGEKVPADYEPKPGETVVALLGDFVVPKDIDGDEVITAVTFDYTGLDATDWLKAQDRFGLAKDVWEFREAMRGLVGSALYTAASDENGSVLYSSYQAYPCRTYLQRNEDGTYPPGSNPKQLLDGTVYGGFTLPSKDGLADEGPGQTDPYQCIIPFEEVPQAVDPAAGFVFTANNDPAAITEDGIYFNDKWHLGGPWDSVRASSIKRNLEACAKDHSCTLETMQAIQAYRVSRLGEVFVPALLKAIAAGETASKIMDSRSAAQSRLAQLWTSNATRFAEVATRIAAWQDAGLDTPSGVTTFYNPAPTDADRDAAVATMIYNAWQGRFFAAVWSDEPVPGWRGSGSRERVRAISRYLNGRGPDNPLDQAAWNPETEEAVFFDRLGTDVLERSDELILSALADALDFLESEPTGPAKGGFGTTDMSTWLWGMRHQAKFQSLLASFLGNNPSFAFLGKLFQIDTKALPLADDMADDDPRKALEWFPRGADQWAVDAGNPGFGGTDFTYGSGPVMRMVIRLRGGEVQGYNVIPGGQSALTDSPHFKDQAALWLANKTVPLRYFPSEVVAGAVDREVFRPQAAE